MKRKYYRPESRAASWSPRFGWLAVLSLLLGIAMHRLGVLATAKLPLLAIIPFVAALVALVLAGRGLFLLWHYGHKGGIASFWGGLLALVALVPIVLAAGMWFILPPVNQISTDLVKPPAFLPGLRPADALPVDANLPQQAAEQMAAWPQLSGRRYDGSPDTILKAVLKVLDDEGWTIAGQKGEKNKDAELVIEATAKTPVMGFISDIIIRLLDEGDTTFVDIRSASRYLPRDFGINARFATQFMDGLDRTVLLAPVESDQ